MVISAQMDSIVCTETATQRDAVAHTATVQRISIVTSINKSVGRVSEGVHTITSVDIDKFARVGSVRSESASGTETVLTVMPVTTPQGSVWRTQLTVMRDTTTAREDMFVSTVRKILSSALLGY